MSRTEHVQPILGKLGSPSPSSSSVPSRATQVCTSYNQASFLPHSDSTEFNVPASLSASVRVSSAHQPSEQTSFSSTSSAGRVSATNLHACVASILKDSHQSGSASSQSRTVNKKVADAWTALREQSIGPGEEDLLRRELPPFDRASSPPSSPSSLSSLRLPSPRRQQYQPLPSHASGVFANFVGFSSRTGGGHDSSIERYHPPSAVSTTDRTPSSPPARYGDLTRMSASNASTASGSASGSSWNLPTSKSTARGQNGCPTVVKLGSKVGIRPRSRPTTPADSNADGTSAAPAPFGASSVASIDSKLRSSGRLSKKLRPRSRPSTSESTNYEPPPFGTLPDGSNITPKESFRRMSSDKSSSTKMDFVPLDISSGWSDFKPPKLDPEIAQNQPLPVKLGLVAPLDASNETKPGPFGTRFVNGYFLHTPPPVRPRRRSFSDGSLAMATSSVFTSASASTSTSQVSAHSPLTLTTVASREPDDQSLRPTVSRQSTDLSNNSNNSGAKLAGASSGPTFAAGPSLKRQDTSSSSGTRVANGSSSLAPATDSSSRPQWTLEEYFTYKTHRVASGGARKVRYHAFPRDKVPYFLAHDQSAISGELYAHNLTFESLSYRHSVIPWEGEKPATVLDLGTGTGAWCLDAARDWKDSEFIGLDVVPVQTSIDAQIEPDLSKRVSWVVANFLEGLPFPNQSFDFVHMRQVGALSIGEDQWPALLSEIVRVLKPQGHLELLEFNWSFVGNLRDTAVEDLVPSAKGPSPNGPATPTGSVAPPSPQVTKAPRPSNQSYAALEDAFTRVLNRRFLNAKVLSVIPGNLTSQDLQQIRTGNPRRVPLTTGTSDFLYLSQLASAASDAPTLTPTPAAMPKADTEQGNGKSVLPVAKPAQETPTTPSPPIGDPAAWTKAYTTRPQVGQPLGNSGFFLAPHNLAMFRSMCIFSFADKQYSARDLLWDEAEEEEAALLSHSVGPQGSGRAATDGTACWAHPWRQRKDFDACMDNLYRDLLNWADVGALLQDRLGWKPGSNLESVAERKMGEKQRKLNEGAAAMASAVGRFDATAGKVSTAAGDTGKAVGQTDTPLGDPAKGSSWPSPVGLGFEVSSPSATTQQYASDHMTRQRSKTMGDESFSLPVRRRSSDAVMQAVSLFDESGASDLADHSAAEPQMPPSMPSSPARGNYVPSPVDKTTSEKSLPGNAPPPAVGTGERPGVAHSTQIKGKPPRPFVGLLGIMETTGYTAKAPVA